MVTKFVASITNTEMLLNGTTNVIVVCLILDRPQIQKMHCSAHLFLLRLPKHWKWDIRFGDGDYFIISHKELFRLSFDFERVSSVL